MIICFGCHRPVSGSLVMAARMCHRVVYLCPECHAATRHSTPSARINRTLPVGREPERSHIRRYPQTNQWSCTLEILLGRG